MFSKFSVGALRLQQLAPCMVLTLTLAACGDGTATSSALTAPIAAGVGAFAPPVITGTPPTSAIAEQKYQYLPHATDLNERALSYDITNKPAWLTFVDTSGELSGTPQASDIGLTAEIEIGVSDGMSRATIGPFRIRISPSAPGAGTAPAIAGTPDATVSAGQAYRFMPTVTNPDGAALSFAIVNRPSWASFNTASGELTGTPTSANVGSFANILISVTGDAATVSLPAFSIDVVAPATNAPAISGTPAPRVSAGELYAFTPLASDPDGRALTFSVRNAPAWASFSTDSGRLSGTPRTRDVGHFANIVISVSDGALTSALPAFAIDVQAAVNVAPTISGTPATSVIAGAAYSFAPSASDPNGNRLSFSASNLPAWARLATDSGAITGTPTLANVGSFPNIIVSVSDGALSASLPAFAIEVKAPPDHAPLISGVPATSVVAGTAYAFTPTASDPDGTALTFSISNPPAWANFNASTGALTGTPTRAQIGSFGNIVIAASDGTASAALPAFAIAVTAPADRAPTISGTPATLVVAGSAYAFTPSASDPDGNSLTFSVRNLPSWATFSAASGAISGTPTAANIGTFSNIVVSVSDGSLASSLPAFSITVSALPDHPPVISGTPAISVVAGSAYAFTPSASDPDGDPLSFAVGNLPGWARFDTASGAISGTPGAADVGTFSNIVVSVSDGSLASSLPAFAITVSAQPDRAPVISGTPASRVVAGSAYAFTPSASDPDGNALSFSVSNLPGWATFDAATGTLSGTPDGAAVGTYANIVIRVSDGHLASALPAFSITVAAAVNPPPTITGTPATTVNAGAAYSFTPTAADPNHNALTFSIANLPSWASFNAQSGRLSGTPAAADAGSYANIGISVSDGTSSATLAPFGITVTQSSNGSVTLNWVPPTQNTDGSPLTNLAGYHIVYGTSAGNLNQSVTVANPGLTSYVLDSLAPGTWYFSVNDYTSAGTVSAISNIVSKTL